MLFVVGCGADQGSGVRFQVSGSIGAKRLAGLSPKSWRRYTYEISFAGHYQPVTDGWILDTHNPEIGTLSL